MGGAHYFVLRQGSGADSCNFSAFYHEKRHVYVITTYNRILQANTPAKYKLNSI